METELINSNHQLVLQEHLDKISDFNKLLNWMSGEFILHQQDDEKGLKVYFPNGWFFINLINESTIYFEIIIKSNCKKTFAKMQKQIVSIVNHFKLYKTLSLK